MAVIGLTELQAINRVLRGSGFEEINDVPTSSNTDEGRDAQTVLNTVTDMILTMGWPENTELGKTYTPDGGGGNTTGDVSVAFTDGTWTVSSHTLTKTGAFAGYTTVTAGDEIYIYTDTADALIKEGYYGVTSKTSANAIVLDHDPAIANSTRIAARKLGNMNITLGSDILKARSSPGSPNSHRHLVANVGDLLYDADLKTSRLENDDALYLDVTRDYTFANLSSPLKETIVAWARIEFQRWKKGLNDRDGFLLQELAVAEAVAPRNPLQGPQEVQPFNVFSGLLQTLRGNQTQDRR